MPKKADVPRKNARGVETAAQKQPLTKRSRQSKQSAEKRLDAIFDSLIDELLTSLEHNYDRRKQEKP